MMQHLNGQPGPTTFVPQHTHGHVLCCLCGASITSNPSNIYLQPPKHWVRAELESKELLTFCIKRLKGLQKVKLVDAGFVWTEPHSRRLKVKLTVQAEVMNGAILQQSFVIEYVVEPHMCIDCTRANTNVNVWTACVQVRQHTNHKRTFFFLEQLILKHDIDQLCISIKEMHEGVDFFFSNRSHALKFVDFVQSVVPANCRDDKQLVSHNEHTATYNYKYTFSVEIVPICRDDLVCVPQKAAAALGGFGPLALCTRVSNTLTLTDPATLRSVQMDERQFQRHPFRAVLGSRQLVEYVVLDAELAGPSTNRFAVADVQVARAADFGRNDRTLFARTHLGHLLHAGDTALGYDLAAANLADSDLEKALERGLVLPDVILVRKSYEEKRRRRKARGHQRAWKLQRMAVDAPDEPAAASGRGRQAARADAPRGEADLERFMEELEEDPELRAKVALYRDPAVDPAIAAARRAAAMADTDEDDEDVPEVLLEELLDDLAGTPSSPSSCLAVKHGTQGAGKGAVQQQVVAGSCDQLVQAPHPYAPQGLRSEHGCPVLLASYGRSCSATSGLAVPAPAQHWEAAGVDVPVTVTPISGEGLAADSGSSTLVAAVPTQLALQAAAPKRASRAAEAPRSRTSRFRGVTKHRRSGRWEAHCWVRQLGRQVYLGGYELEEHAAEAYDVAALKCRGLHVKINFDLRRYADLTACLDSISLEELIMAVRRQSQGFSRGTSTFRGVTHHPSGRWEARIGVPSTKTRAASRHIYLGLHASEVDAAKVYDASLVRMRGTTAATNFALSEYRSELADYLSLQMGLAHTGNHDMEDALGGGGAFETWVRHGHVKAATAGGAHPDPNPDPDYNPASPAGPVTPGSGSGGAWGSAQTSAALAPAELVLRVKMSA
ncbi:hypothetical protein WJX81_000414 [Elliptochloris bilobata]|uniref:60S ribosomal export protein NMD3 n=1 Tax=Elliptochloris bilobata TaxID=381761 RepID=A0AAW1SL23_9CHLO